VVDNCEHLLDAARDMIVTLLDACPRLTVFATSRESLGLPQELIWRLAPLPLPSGDQDRSAVASVELFIARGCRIRPELEPTGAQLSIVGDIVSRLDGMPLAIELAAGRLSTFSLTDLRDRLDRSLDLLGGGRPTSDRRHRTLRSTIAWSYDLLDDDERQLFRHLTVFADGVDLATAETLAGDLGVAGDPGAVLARLVDASVITVDFSSGATRYRILETIRAFGLDRLADAGEQETAEELLLRWAIDLAADIGATLMTDREPEADATLRRELGNLRAAWRLARGRESLDAAVSMINSLFDAISYRDLVELRGWAQELAADPVLVDHPGAPFALGVAAEAVYHSGDTARAEALSRTGLELAATPDAAWTCLATLSVTALARGAFNEVIDYSLRAEKVSPRPAEPLGVAALAAVYSGDIERARSFNNRAIAGARFPSMVAWNAYVFGEIENFAGNGLDAETHYVRAIELARTTGATFLVGISTVGLLTVRARSGRNREALWGYHEVIEYFGRTGNWTHLWAALRNLADLLDTLGDKECAAMLRAAADQAPDAPAYDRPPAPRVPVPDRSAMLEATRSVIEQQLRRTES
jgi:predicted ATPase